MIGEFDEEAKCVSWMDFCGWAYHHRARITDWPDNVDAPGPAFRFRELSTPDLRMLGQPYVDHVKDNADTQYPKIEPWPESEYYRVYMWIQRAHMTTLTQATGSYWLRAT